MQTNKTEVRGASSHLVLLICEFPKTPDTHALEWKANVPVCREVKPNKIQAVQIDPLQQLLTFCAKSSTPLQPSLSKQIRLIGI